MIVNRVDRYLSSKYCHKIASKNGQMHWIIVVAKIVRKKRSTRSSACTEIKRERESETFHETLTPSTIKCTLHCKCELLPNNFWYNMTWWRGREWKSTFALCAHVNAHTHTYIFEQKRINTKTVTKKNAIINWGKIQSVKCKWVYRNKSYHHK